jgi:hypothetical protein
VGVHIEPKRRVEALHERDRSRVRVGDARQTELALGPPAERAQHLLDERADDRGGQGLTAEAD